MATAAGNASVGPEVSSSIEPRSERRLEWVVNVTMWLGALFVAASAGIHLHLWLAGYRNIPTIGPLFVGQAVAGFLLAAALAWTRRAIVAILSALFLVATIGGLLTSVWFGLFGFRDGFDAPYAGLSLFVESSGAVVLCAGALLARIECRRDGMSPSLPGGT